MKIVYHALYNEVYASDPAASAGRIEAILRELEGEYEFAEPGLALEDDLRKVHTQFHIESIKRDHRLYEVACLA
ncbi:MAG: histone deacetylase family protein, partial [Dehalococcoidia bacterium]|nr:histone deacetylase family protein [Dehalococcoidia bacterium]